MAPEAWAAPARDRYAGCPKAVDAARTAGAKDCGRCQDCLTSGPGSQAIAADLDRGPPDSCAAVGTASRTYAGMHAKGTLLRAAPARTVWAPQE